MEFGPSEMLLVVALPSLLIFICQRSLAECVLNQLLKLVAIVALVSLLALSVLVVSDIHLRTNNIQTIINATTLPLESWIQSKREEKQKVIDVRNHIEVMMRDGYSLNAGGLLSDLKQLSQFKSDSAKLEQITSILDIKTWTMAALEGEKITLEAERDALRDHLSFQQNLTSILQSLEEERIALVAERDVLREQLSTQRNITADSQRFTLNAKRRKDVCEKNLRSSYDAKRILVTEAWNLSNESKILNDSVQKLKLNVANITSVKNKCEANLTKTTILLKNCMNRKEGLFLELQAKKCWL